MLHCRRLGFWAMTALLALAAAGVRAELRFRIRELDYEVCAARLRMFTAKR